MKIVMLQFCLLAVAVTAIAQNSYDPAVPKPTKAEVRYGEDDRHVLDFWKAESDRPTPVAFVIHGGGWLGGSKERLQRFADAQALLDAGISVVAINYRLIPREGDSPTEPPVKAPLHDAARALQFVRSKAAEWNIDKERIGAAGGSAGACSSLWLAYHEDLADPDSDDPVARESTLLWCAAVLGAQTTLDPKQMKEWTPNSRYGGHAFGVKPFNEFLAARERILPWIKEYSPYANVSADDPPVYLRYNAPPAIGKEQKDPTHSANFGVKLQEHCLANNLECELVYPGAQNVVHQTTTEFLIAKLTESRSEFVSLFNGKDLSGWEGEDGLWKVEDGVVVGVCEGPDHFEHNTFLIWRGGELQDFELRATVRIVGDNNSGIQYRSRQIPKFGPYAISGYQCDIHPAIEHTGMTYEEKGRGIFGLNGKNVLLDPEGERWLLSEHDPVKADLSDWTEFHVIARGNHFVHKVNGQITSEFTDHHEGRSMDGLLAIQLHRGNPHRIEIRELLLKKLEPTGPMEFDSKALPEGATKIEKPRTTRPQGTGPIQPKQR
ncbi:MAG: family 16 glycoside hydrolase [Verrucomicrobiota bacterium]